MLGICYGMQAMADALGGDVARTGAAEFGKTELDIRGGVLLHDVGDVDSCWMSHNDAVVRAPDGFGVTASTPSTPVAAMEDPERGLYAVQFHPEVGHTPRGTDMLKNFLSDACHAPATWTALAVIDEQVELIRAQVGDARVICGLSGGVDSVRGRAARVPRHRRSADLRLRRSRPHAPERVRAGRARRSATTSTCRSCTSRPPSASWRSSPA